MSAEWSLVVWSPTYHLIGYRECGDGGTESGKRVRESTSSACVGVNDVIRPQKDTKETRCEHENSKKDGQAV